MSFEKSELCVEVESSIADVLEGLAPARVIDHIAECDRCRDFRYEAEQAVVAMEFVGADFHPTEGFADRMLGLVLEARPDGPQPSMSRSSISLTPPTSGEQPRVLSRRESGPMTEAPTQFAPPPEGTLDSHATIFDPSMPTMLGASTMVESSPNFATQIEPPDPTEEEQAGAAIQDPYAPTHKTIPLSAVLGKEQGGGGKTELSARHDTGGLVEEGPRVVGATTGRNNTGPTGADLQTSPGYRPPAARPAGPTVPQTDREPAKLLPIKGSVRISPSSNDATKRVVPGRKRGVVSLFKNRGFVAALVGGMAAAAAIGAFVIKGKSPVEPPKVAQPDGAWSGTVQSVARASNDGQSGFEVCKGTCKPAAAGVAFEPGSTLKTDSKTRARVKLSDDTWIALDRNSELTLPTGAIRQAKLEKGLIVADVHHIEGGKPAKIVVPQGEIEVIGTKVALTVTERRAAVEVVRGEVSVTSTAGAAVKVRAGEEATLGEQGEPVVASKTTMSDNLEWSSENPDEIDAPALRGVGELRAKKLGQNVERAGAVKLTKHGVKTRIVDVVARTEIDETFTNTTDEELEGIFRFPLPPGAQIENLSLEVNGKLVQGAFEERGRAGAIFRGAEQNSTPKAPKPKEEIIWVPGPWHDPALLEWQRGGRFELKIFPIPRKGSRRIVLSYTQTVPQSGGVRRFTYPLAHDTSGSTSIDEFNVDLQVLDHDQAFGVETRGYQLAKAEAPAGADRLTLGEHNFVPSGDLTIEYALPSRKQELTAWAYDMPASPPVTNASPTVSGPAPSTPSGGQSDADKKKAAEAEARAFADDRSPFVALALRPTLPRFPEGKERLHVIVVDSSRSMVGERFSRATRLAAGIVREMDRRDQFMLLACDTTCEVMGATEARTIPVPLEPSAEAAQQVESFLGSVEPDGGSNLVSAVHAARTAAGALSGRELRILYLGDGTPSVGPTKPATIEAGVRHILPASDGSVIAVALGADADTTSLAALARGGSGVVVPYVPGQRVNAAAVDVLASAYGSVLSDVEVVLPAGLSEITPRRIDPIPAGGEAFVFARMPGGKQVDGTVTLRGRIGNDRFEQSYKTNIVASSGAGNAFVPRLFASAKIDELEQLGTAEDGPRIVALSKQFSVASRHTSLLVLESDTMFEAFGVKRNGYSPVFTGEERAQSSSSDAEGEEDAPANAGESAGADEGKAEKGGGKTKDKKSRGFDDGDLKSDPAKETTLGHGAGAGGGGLASGGPMPSSRPAQAAPPMEPSAPATKSPPRDSSSNRNDPLNAALDPFDPSWGRRPQQQPTARPRMIPMKKVFDRRASFSSERLLATEVSKALVDAQGASKAAPDSRDKTVALYRLLMASGRVGEGLELAARWSERDALDPDALVARADLAAMNGDRPRAIRILSGLADVRPGDKAVQKRLAAAFTQMGAPDVACQHRIALADIDPTDASAVAAAVRCSQDQGFANLGQALVASAPSNLREKIDSSSKTLKLADIPALAGDLRVTATWNTPVDLDLAFVDKNGKRLSWLGSPLQNVSVTSKDSVSTNTETLAVAGLSSGNLMVEIVRAKGDKSSAPVTGELVFTLPGGETRKVPFTLTGQRIEVGSLRVFFNVRLVPATQVGGRWR